MHIHLPKPLHGWREFLGEVGVIVIGVLIALGAEQGVEALHHRAQVQEATDKLHAESVENRSAVDFSIRSLERAQASVVADLAVLGNCGDANAPRRLAALEPFRFLVPTDSAWVGARDSELLPLLPARLTDSYFKVDTVKDLMLPVLNQAGADGQEAAATVDALRLGVRDPALCPNAVVQLLRAKAVLGQLLGQTKGFKVFNEEALRGEIVDAVKRPPSSDVRTGTAKKD